MIYFRWPVVTTNTKILSSYGMLAWQWGQSLDFPDDREATLQGMVKIDGYQTTMKHKTVCIFLWSAIKDTAKREWRMQDCALIGYPSRVSRQVWGYSQGVMITCNGSLQNVTSYNVLDTTHIEVMMHSIPFIILLITWFVVHCFLNVHCIWYADSNVIGMTRKETVIWTNGDPTP